MALETCHPFSALQTTELGPTAIRPHRHSAAFPSHSRTSRQRFANDHTGVECMARKCFRKEYFVL